MDKKSKIILIAGPTASGKSNFAIKLAKKVDGEIINTDSMQIYKEIKILNARPKPTEIQNIVHHLYGFHSVRKNFSTGDWLKKTIKLIKQIHKKNKIGGPDLRGVPQIDIFEEAQLRPIALKYEQYISPLFDEFVTDSIIFLGFKFYLRLSNIL